jgi:hypothetical protein
MFVFYLLEKWIRGPGTKETIRRLKEKEKRRRRNEIDNHRRK